MTCTCGHDKRRHLHGRPQLLGVCRIKCGCAHFTPRKTFDLGHGTERIYGRSFFASGGRVANRRVDSGAGEGRS